MSIFGPKIYELPLSEGYVAHWTYLEAVRELLQNAIDSDSPFEWAFGPDWMTITSRMATLLPSTLLLGATSKADAADKIGSFGEGYKIALLVLARENFNVSVFNGKRVWRPSFRWNPSFGANALCIEDSAGTEPNEGLTFRIDGLSFDQMEAITQSCLAMQPPADIGHLIPTTKGNIMLERPGKLYVNGLFVCDTGLEYGYNIKPEFLKLERDRQTVSNFDLQWQTKEMWFETGRVDEIAALLDEACPDLAYANHGTPELVKEACYRLFQKKFPGAVLAKSQKELEQMVSAGMTTVIVHHASAFGDIVQSAPAHQRQAAIRITPPAELMQAFFRKHRSDMRTPAVKAFKELTELSKTWKGAGAK